jgi:hypothetical protein
VINKVKIEKSIEKVLGFEALSDIGELIDLTVNGKELTDKA